MLIMAKLQTRALGSRIVEPFRARAKLLLHSTTHTPPNPNTLEQSKDDVGCLVESYEMKNIEMSGYVTVERIVGILTLHTSDYLYHIKIDINIKSKFHRKYSLIIYIT
ncbi:hypothetical protein RND71_036951 [Anisodus tanguticus]|uniref:Uncharacterized protein n=1 Tax=Anisodus tanguticus TaxID=243964 RepID=A0AAE1R4M6_9SOLA|nr:hypothetical protein RND71_036951 [Anisodus tanguticus]